MIQPAKKPRRSWLSRLEGLAVMAGASGIGVLIHLPWWSPLALFGVLVVASFVAVLLISWSVAANRPRLLGRMARLSVSSLTDLALLLVGSRRRALRDEWRAHLAGESGHAPVNWRKVRQALGFVAAAIQLRLADAADLAWRPADAVLGSRTLSNLFVSGPVIVTLFAIVRHDGRFGLVGDIQDAGELVAFLYGVIRLGRWWRQIKLPPPKPRRAQEADSGADQGRPSPE